MTTFVVVFLSEMHVDLSLFPFGGVFVVEPDLSEDGDVYHNLQASANDELRWSLTQVKISGFEDVPASPHEHHLQAHAIGGFVGKISVELGRAQHCLCEDG